MARLGVVVALLCVLVLAASGGGATAAPGPGKATAAAKKCKKGQALHKRRCVRRCPRGYAKKRSRGRTVCRKQATPTPPPDENTVGGDGTTPPQADGEPIQGEEAKQILRSLLLGRIFENAGTTFVGDTGSVSGREQYAFCESRYAWYSFTSSSVTGGQEDGDAGPWSVVEAVADPSRTKAVGRLQLNPEGREPRTIEVGIDDNGPDRVAGYDMESKPFDCAAAGA